MIHCLVPAHASHIIAPTAFLQFGHLFSKGRTREAAIRAMVVALKEIKIRGEIHHICDYVTELLQDEEFLGDGIHTGWLDSRIAAQVGWLDVWKNAMRRIRYGLVFCLCVQWIVCTVD